LDDLPWRSLDDGVLFHSADATQHVAMDAEGAHFLRPLRATESVPWTRIDSIGINLPTAPIAGYWFNAILSAIGPHFFTYNERDTLIEVCVRGESELAIWKNETWNLGRSRRYSWRLAWILAELHKLLSEGNRWSVLGVPGLLDAVVQEIVTTVPWWSRALVNTDLPGLNERIGGNGAYDDRIEQIIARFMPKDGC